MQEQKHYQELLFDCPIHCIDKKRNRNKLDEKLSSQFTFYQPYYKNNLQATALSFQNPETLNNELEIISQQFINTSTMIKKEINFENQAQNIIAQLAQNKVVYTEQINRLYQEQFYQDNLNEHLHYIGSQAQKKNVYQNHAHQNLLFISQKLQKSEQHDQTFLNKKVRESGLEKQQILQSTQGISNIQILIEGAQTKLGQSYTKLQQIKETEKQFSQKYKALIHCLEQIQILKQIENHFLNTNAIDSLENSATEFVDTLYTNCFTSLTKTLEQVQNTKNRLSLQQRYEQVLSPTNKDLSPASATSISRLQVQTQNEQNKIKGLHNEITLFLKHLQINYQGLNNFVGIIINKYKEIKSEETSLTTIYQQYQTQKIKLIQEDKQLSQKISEYSLKLLKSPIDSSETLLNCDIQNNNDNLTDIVDNLALESQEKQMFLFKEFIYLEDQLIRIYNFLLLIYEITDDLDPSFDTSLATISYYLKAVTLQRNTPSSNQSNEENYYPQIYKTSSLPLYEDLRELKNLVKKQNNQSELQQQLQNEISKLNFVNQIAKTFEQIINGKNQTIKEIAL